MKFSATSFPVRADPVLDAPQQTVLGETIAASLPGQVAELVLQRWRLWVEADEDETAPLFDAGRVEPVIGLVERVHVRMSNPALVVRDAGLGGEERRPEARAVEVVGPGVVGALEEPLDAAALAGSARAACRDGGRRCDEPAARRPGSCRRSASGQRPRPRR